jgi:hypothetical protein
VPQPQAASSSYGYPGQAPPVGGAASSYDHPAFNQFRNDPMAQMAFQALKGGMDMASKEVDQNLNRWINVASLKQYFNVSNSYVVSKLCLILWPWRHRPWTRQQRLSHDGQDGLYLPPREDVNAPDMYIPLMALITYILISALMAGLKSAFHPELFGSMATKAIISVAAEILLLKASMYLWLNINSTAQLLHLVAYSGYKFVSVIVILVFDEMWSGGGWFSFRWWVRMTVFLYTWFALGLVLVSTGLDRYHCNIADGHNRYAPLNMSYSHKTHPTTIAVPPILPQSHIESRGEYSSPSIHMPFKGFLWAS